MAAGLKPEVFVLSDELDEIVAIKLEAELIVAFGTEDQGGVLTNSVVPSGKANPKSANLATPPEALAKAQLALTFLRDAVYQFAFANPDGVSNSEVANHLGLQSDLAGNSINYLSYSVLGILLRERKVQRKKRGGLTVYVPVL